MKIDNDPTQNKIAPRLRMVANASSVVNTVRAERAAAVAVADETLLRDVPQQRAPDQRSAAPAELAGRAARGHQVEMPNEIRFNVFVGLTGDRGPLPAAVRHRRPRRIQNLLSVSIPQDELAALQDDPAVAYVELAERIVFSPPLSSTPSAEEPPSPAWLEQTAELHNHGEGVLIGIVDVQGFDFSHPDFLDEDGETRFVAIWDQGGAHRPPPAGFSYGAELRRDHLNAALAAAGEVGAAPYQLEPQTQMARGSHGTHVAGIAAGASGICRRAQIAAVLINLPQEDQDSRRSFYDSTRIADAIDYLFRHGEELGLPVSVNISLGTNGHAHDASSAVSRWLDYALVTPGRSICVAAGNAGQEAPLRPGDLGYTMGRIHTSGRIPAAGLVTDIEWVVIGDGSADLSENELEIWYSPQDEFSVALRPPGSSEWIGPVAPNEFIENRLLDSGAFVSIYNERYWPANGANLIGLYLSPFFSEHGVVGVPAGVWTVRLTGLQVRDGVYHGWIERDDPRRWGPGGGVTGWSFPSFFSERSNVDGSSVSSLACGHRVIAVANLDPENELVNRTSSQGPTRDNREKPEIAARGTNVVAANGFEPGRPWVAKTGTSMASPRVAGVVGLMLATQPSLTAAQIGGILRRTAQPLPGVDFAWQNDAGFGRLDAAAAIRQAAASNQRRDLTDEDN